jgi:hypothetical protein
MVRLETMAAAVCAACGLGGPSVCVRGWCLQAGVAFTYVMFASPLYVPRCRVSGYASASCLVDCRTAPFCRALKIVYYHAPCCFSTAPQAVCPAHNVIWKQGGYLHSQVVVLRCALQTQCKTMSMVFPGWVCQDGVRGVGRRRYVRLRCRGRRLSPRRRPLLMQNTVVHGSSRTSQCRLRALWGGSVTRILTLGVKI